MKEMMPYYGSITIELVISFLIFLFFFGWIGLQRGARREAWVFIIATASWLVLQARGDILVRIANLGGKLLALIAAGGLSEDGGDGDPLASLDSAQTLVTEKYEIGFIFMIWFFIVIVAYVFTNNLIRDKDSKPNGWAIIWGIANGLFFASIFLPRLAMLWAPRRPPGEQWMQPMPDVHATPPPMVTDGRGSIVTFLSQGIEIVSKAIAGLWSMLGPIQPYVVLGLLILFLVLVYSTIKNPRLGPWKATRTTVTSSGSVTKTTTTGNK